MIQYKERCPLSHFFVINTVSLKNLPKGLRYGCDIRCLAFFVFEPCRDKLRLLMNVNEVIKYIGLSGREE